VRASWAPCSIVVVTVIMRLREAAAAGPLWWINPMAGGGTAWALGLKACRFQLAGALVVRQYRCACLALHHLRRRGRTYLLGSMVRVELAVRQQQGQSSIGRLGLVTLITLVVRLSLKKPTTNPRPIRMLGTFVNRNTRLSRAYRRRVGYREHQNRSVLLRM